MVQASGVRIGWADLPGSVREGIEGLLGEPVVGAVSQPGGFSPGTADRVVTAGGRRAFVKAVGAALNEHSPVMHRAEARIAALLPAGVPAPRLLGVHDDGDWVALVFEDVVGRLPRTPWESADLTAVLGTLREVAVPIAGLPSLREGSAEDFGGWRRLAAAPPASLDPWAAGRLDLLAGLADRGLAALAGDRLVHGDIRADNLVIRADGSVSVVDWPHACVGPAWFDTLSLLLNVRLYGGRIDDAVVDADPDAVTGCLAGLAGFFAERALQPPPPGLPTLRRFQQAQAEVLILWLRDRLAGT
ncbi:phosphotransferase family protein [Dactylosporangium sp. CA-092794]|uniref:phosphotransferase family protein n=1 Tax=Dactylosporangium sp. CA-092794 TaxID=3239929 RepID=UPI003D914964